jgi:hypothetical protein
VLLRRCWAEVLFKAADCIFGMFRFGALPHVVSLLRTVADLPELMCAKPRISYG